MMFGEVGGGWQMMGDDGVLGEVSRGRLRLDEFL